MPHIDADISHLVFIYYVNDSDGDTVFFKQKFNGFPVKNLDEEFRISPKAGTAVLFDGNQYHASSSPVNSDYRCVLNIDFLGHLNLSNV
jgi:ectoine hydroxylase-related dioxygenase (phytanoyl-CoA dioxygenase family)